MCPSVATCLTGSVVSVVDMFSLGIYFQGDFAIPSVRLGGAIQGDFHCMFMRYLKFKKQNNFRFTSAKKILQNFIFGGCNP
jgi:tetrahydromethanopterin S-methyltransferase subunit D